MQLFNNCCHCPQQIIRQKCLIRNAKCQQVGNIRVKDIERKSLLEYIKSKKSTSTFTKMIDQIVETTKQNQTFRGDYMAWGLAEQDAEKRGYKAGVVDGAEQKAIETAKNFLKMVDKSLLKSSI